MGLCPKCKTESRARKDGACPVCATPIMVYDGHWFEDSTDSPPNQLIRYLEDIINKNVNIGRSGTPVMFRIKRFGPRYQREIVNIKRMFDATDYDLDLTKRAIDVFMTHKQFRNKNITSFAQIIYDFDLALAIARAELEDERKEQEKLAALTEKLQAQGSIFK